MEFSERYLQAGGGREATRQGGRGWRLRVHFVDGGGELVQTAHLRGYSGLGVDKRSKFLQGIRPPLQHFQMRGELHQRVSAAAARSLVQLTPNNLHASLYRSRQIRPQRAPVQLQRAVPK